MKTTSGFSLLMLCLAGLLAISEPAIAQNSHISQNINHHIVLRGMIPATGSQACNFEQVLPNGTRQEFTIPSDQQLVITDVEWQAQNKMISGGNYSGWTIDFEPGDAVWLEVTIAGTAVFSSRTTSIQVSSRSVGTNEQLTTGFVVEEKRFCGRIQVISYPMPSEIGMWYGNFGQGFLILRGYLVETLSQQENENTRNR